MDVSRSRFSCSNFVIQILVCLRTQMSALGIKLGEGRDVPKLKKSLLSGPRGWQRAVISKGSHMDTEPLPFLQGYLL